MQVFVCDICTKVVKKPSKIYSVTVAPYQTMNSLNSAKRKKMQICEECCLKFLLIGKESEDVQA